MYDKNGDLMGYSWDVFNGIQVDRTHVIKASWAVCEAIEVAHMVGTEQEH